MADSEAASNVRTVSTTLSNDCGLASMVSPPCGGAVDDDDSSSITEVAGNEVEAVVGEEDESLSEVACAGWSFFSFNFASSPSTLFRRASRTSVLGPLFLGTASVHRNNTHGQLRTTHQT